MRWPWGGGPECGPGTAGQQPVDTTFTKAVHWGPTGWKPTGVGAHASEQIGMYGDVVLTRRFMLLPGLQRRSRGFNPSGWDVATHSLLPIWQQTKTPGNMAGGQRHGAQAHDGSLTPWTAAQLQGAVAAAQVAQSGLANAAFTHALIQANLEAA